MNGLDLGPLCAEQLRRFGTLRSLRRPPVAITAVGVSPGRSPR
jgi:hypothetical protein